MDNRLQAIFSSALTVGLIALLLTLCLTYFPSDFILGFSIAFYITLVIIGLIYLVWHRIKNKNTLSSGK